MTDLSRNSAALAKPQAQSSLFTEDTRTKKRNAAERRFRFYGIGAIGLGVLFLMILLWSIMSNGLPAFTQTTIKTDFTLSQEQFDAAESKMLKTAEYEKIVAGQLSAAMKSAGIETEVTRKDLKILMSGGVGSTIREYYRANPDELGKAISFSFPAGGRIDGFVKGRVTRATAANDSKVDLAQLDLADEMEAAGILKSSFSWNFIFGTDKADTNPEGAGMGAAMLGSLAMMLTVLGVCLPISVAAAVYLEEFAPKNRATDFIEVNISNLAAVPSIVFGILALAVFIQFMHLPASAPLVGGLALSLMTLPTIIIATRASLKAVPPSIRDAALGVGASKMQATFHHVVPLAMPGILTGTIIGLAAALGETAPLLLIGMVGLIATDYPISPEGLFLDPNAAMPAQIYVWANRADPAWVERAWGGIIILLAFLISMNIIAIILRRRFERRW